MKKIHLHGPAADNAGLFVDAGAELDVADGDKAGTITAERAKALVDSHAARVVPVAEKAARPRKSAPPKKPGTGRPARQVPTRPTPSAEAKDGGSDSSGVKPD